MDELNGNRVQAWKDTLSSDELNDVMRLEGMPTNMAVAYVYVEFRRAMSQKRSVLQHVSAGASGAFIAAAAMFAHWMGWDKLP